jgi:hypothetical protein
MSTSHHRFAGGKSVMRPTNRPRDLVFLILVGGLAAARGIVCCGADRPDPQRMKAEHERRQAEFKRRFEETSQRIKAARERHRPQSPGQRAPAGISTPRAGTSKAPATAASAPPFDAASAPSPAECFRAYVAAARRASSMEQVLPFLPEGEQKSLRAYQATYDPQQAAHGRQWHRQQDPKISEETLDHLSNPPFTNALKFHQGLAKEVIDVLSFKIDGNKAKLVVSTSSGATIDGQYYPYSKANVEMIGEERTWKLSRYKPSIMYYKDVPR